MPLDTKREIRQQAELLRLAAELLRVTQERDRAVAWARRGGRTEDASRTK